MPKAITPLNTKQIQNAKPTKMPYTLADGNGLQLLIKPNGIKLWEFYYQSPTKIKRRKTSFSTFPEVSLKEARDKRDEYKKLIFQGIDPIDYFKDKKTTLQNQTEGLVENIVDEWMQRQKERLAPTTYERKYSLLQKDLVAFFKQRTISSIDHHEIVKILEMKSIQAPEVASRLLSYLDKIWRYAAMKGYCKFNIIANIDKYLEKGSGPCPYLPLSRRFKNRIHRYR